MTLLGLLALIGVSILAARQKADEAYAQFDNLNSGYRNLDTRLRQLQSDLHLSGILVRDYLLDTRTPAADYRSRLMQLKTESYQALAELEPLLRATDPKRYEILRTDLDDYWNAYEPLFDGNLIEERYAILQRDVIPRRDGVMAISAEIEAINNANLDDEHRAALARQDELRQYLTSMLSRSLALGLVVAIVAVIRIRVLERRSQDQHAESEQTGHEMRRLSNQLLRTQEEERKNLSRELHDEVGQMLTALRMELGRLERAHVVGSPAFAASAAESKLLIDKMMRLVRDLAMGLRPSMLDDLGLEPALAWQTREFSRHFNTPVDLTVEGDLERLSDSHRTCVYRVVQEALTNCAKHSEATRITVAVRGSADTLEVTVADNGVGIDKESSHRGLGLTGIKERVKEMDGRFSIDRAPGGGTTLQAILPVPASKERKETAAANTAGR
jgi:signal transduction histidine kinase